MRTTKLLHHRRLHEREVLHRDAGLQRRGPAAAAGTPSRLTFALSNKGLWYGLATMRAPCLALLVVVAACHGPQIYDLPLQWRGVDSGPAASTAVAQSFAAVPLAFSVRDVRPDPSAVGTYEDDGHVVRTSANVGAYCSTKLGELLVHAGARLNEAPRASLETELLEYRVVEGGTFHGIVRVRAIVRRPAGDAWAKIYEGSSKRWGKTHNPDNFNEALSNALADVATQLVHDEDFAQVLLSVAPEPAPPAGG